MLKKIATDKAPAAIGPYSQGIVAGDFLFASGQIPIIPATGELETGTIEEQAHQCMKNIGAILAEAGTDYTKWSKPPVFWQIWQISVHLTVCMSSTLQRNRQEAV